MSKYLNDFDLQKPNCEESKLGMLLEVPNLKMPNFIQPIFNELNLMDGFYEKLYLK